jgi:hypothetical protein
MVGLDL